MTLNSNFKKVHMLLSTGMWFCFNITPTLYPQAVWQIDNTIINLPTDNTFTWCFLNYETDIRTSHKNI